MSPSVSSASPPQTQAQPITATGDQPATSWSRSEGTAEVPEWVVDETRVQMQQLPLSEQQDKANHMAQTLSPAELEQYERAFPPGMMDTAVENHAPADVKQAYQAEHPPASQADIDALAELEQTSNKAHERVETHNREVGKLLAQAGPLTPEQRHDFIEAYKNDSQHPERARAYRDADAADQALATYVGQHHAALLRASQTNPDAAQKLHDAIGRLAGSGHGQQALALLTSILGDPATEAAFSTFDDLQGTLLQDSVSAATAEALAANDWNPVLAANQIKLEMQGLAGIGDIAGANKLLDEIAGGNFDSLKRLGAEFGQASPLMRAVGGAGILLGAAAATGYANDGQYVDAVKEFAGAGAEGLKLVASATEHLVETGRVASTGSTLAHFAERFAPILGLAASATALVADAQKAQSGNPGYVIAILGDAVSFIGSCVEVFPPAAAIGAVINGIGNAIWAIGTLIGDVIDSAETRTQIADYLGKAGIEPDVANAMANSGKQLLEMADRLEMSPEQVQSLVKSHPAIGADPGHAGKFTDAAQACGITGDKVAGFAAALAKDSPGFAEDLMGLSNHIPRDPNQAAAFYRHYVESRYPSAAGFAKGVSPELFGNQAQDREVAQSDFSAVSGRMDWAQQLAVCLHNNDSPAYRAELMRLLVQADGQKLEDFAEAMADGSAEWKEDTRESVKAALATGTLTQAQADMVLSHL